MSQTNDVTFRTTDDAVRMVGAAVAADEFRRASDIADRALSQGLIHPALFNARALWLERQGRNEDALVEFQRARALAPKDVTLLNAIGLCMNRLYRLEEALETFDEAIRAMPAYAPTYQRKGVVLALLGRQKEAEQAYVRAVQLQPTNADALANLASIMVAKGDERAARRYAERALGADPHNTTAQAALSLLEIEHGQFVEAEQRLYRLIEAPGLAGQGRAVARGLLGDALDGQNRSADAFAAYAAANAELHALHAPRFQGKPTTFDVVKNLSGWLEGASAHDRSPADDVRVASPDDPRQHVFLLGFHRSGTTLLEQVLKGHPDVVTLEERDLLAELAERTLTNRQDLDRLESLSGPALAYAREEYWRRVRGENLAVRDKVFVDKHPLNTIKLPLIFKLFPDALILFALRDPRDVVLSCFRRHFEINAVMFEYLSLDGIANLYDGVMRVGMLSRALFPLRVHEVRYEAMVADFDGQTQSLCKFLGLPWNSELRKFSDAAAIRDVRSPSAQQVRRDLYTEGEGQWRRYREQLAPVLPTLEPWIARFGYPQN
ncbi:MAG: sulfotransferase [Rhizomicrobium sp.]|jgi:Flp pilus assembly protein TadD